MLLSVLSPTPIHMHVTVQTAGVLGSGELLRDLAGA